MPDLGMTVPNMGMKRPVRATRSNATRTASLADALFTGTQQRVLGLLFGQPTRSYYATELIGLAGGGSGAVQRELARPTRSELVTVRPVGNQRHYQANPAIGEDIAYVQYKWPIGKPRVDHLRGAIWEVRTCLGNRTARTLFAVAGNQLVLLHGFIKKTQRTPNDAIDLAESRFKEWRDGET